MAHRPILRTIVSLATALTALVAVNQVAGGSASARVHLLAPAAASPAAGLTGLPTTVCAHSVRVTRWVPGSGPVEVWGKQVTAGRQVVVYQRFAHKPGTTAKRSCERGGSDQFRAVNTLSALNRMVWGTTEGLLGSAKAPSGTRLGTYRYTAVARTVVCTQTDDGLVVRCGRPQAAGITYRVTVRPGLELEPAIGHFAS